MIYFGGGNLKKRKSGNFSELKRNVHHNSGLQKAYNLSSKENFEFIVLLYCEKFECERYEQFFVNRYENSGLLYNICIKDVGSRKGVKASEKTKKKMSKNCNNKGKDNPFYGKYHTREAIKKMSGKNNGMWGKVYSPEEIEKMRKNNPNTIEKEKVLKILAMLDQGIFQREIAKKMGISRRTVYKVKKGKYNDIYDLGQGG